MEPLRIPNVETEPRIAVVADPLPATRAKPARRMVRLVRQEVRPANWRLQEDLAARNIPVVPDRIAARHKQKLLDQAHARAAHRPVLRLFAPLVVTIASNMSLLVAFALVALVVLLIGVGDAALSHNFLLLAVGGVGMASWIVLIRAAGTNAQWFNDMESAMSHWEERPLVPPEPRLLRRMHAAEKVPGVTTYVEAFLEDPLIFAKRETQDERGRSFTEVCCIGGWNTGDRDIDNA